MFILYLDKFIKNIDNKYPIFMLSNEQLTPDSTYLRPKDGLTNSMRDPNISINFHKQKNGSPIMNRIKGKFQSNSFEYQMQHNKWGSLRNKMKTMKLDNITVRSYKNTQLICDKINNINNQTNNIKNSEDIIYKYGNLKLSNNFVTEKRKNRQSIPSSNTKDLLMCYTQSASSKNKTQSLATKRIFHSRTNPSYSKSNDKNTNQMAAIYRPRNRQNMKRAKSNTSHEKLRNPESVGKLHKKNISQFCQIQAYQNNLKSISKISQKDIQQRIIVRKKSEICKNNMQILAWQSSIVRKKNILFQCDEIKQNQNIDDFEISHNQLQKKLAGNNYKLILGDAQCSKYQQSLFIQDLARLASVLLDYLQIDYLHKKLILCKDQILTKSHSNQFRTQKQQIYRAIDKSPFIYVPGTAHLNYRKKISNLKISPFIHKTNDQHYPCQKLNGQLNNIKIAEMQNPELTQSNDLQKNEGKLNQNPKNQNIGNQKMSEIAEQWSRIQLSKNITEDIQNLSQQNTISLKQQNKQVSILQESKKISENLQNLQNASNLNKQSSVFQQKPQSNKDPKIQDNPLDSSNDCQVIQGKNINKNDQKDVENNKQGSLDQLVDSQGQRVVKQTQSQNN